jgi:heat shock protein HtpX
MTQQYGIDPSRIAANRRRNFLHAALIVGSMVVLLAAVGWFMAGPLGLVIIGTFAGVTLVAGPRVSQRLMLQIYSATVLNRRQVPMLYDLVEDLRERAEIEPPVKLYYIPSRLMLAFTVGGQDEISLAVSDGLLRRLTGREIAGVLAHELSHVAHHDLTLMALADFVTKVTRTLAFLALLLLAINLPYLMEGDVAIPWPPIVLLMLAPVLSLLLQLGLSRAREYDADAGAALLTGDPEGIATALEKMDAQQRRYWENMFGRQGTIDQPSLLRTHPPTSARVAALAEIARHDAEDIPDLPDDILPPGEGSDPNRPRRRFHGFRY